MKRILLSLVLLAAACRPSVSVHEAPSSVVNPVAESEIALVRLTPEAERRLAIETARVTPHDTTAVRRVGGEVIVPPGRVLTVTSPVAGLVRAVGDVAPGTHVNEGDELLEVVPLAPVDRDTRARADREVEAARATLEAAQKRLSRTENLARQAAGSQRAIEEATADRDVARADLQAARRRVRAMRAEPLLADVSMTVRAPEDGIVRALSVAPGQVVHPGAPLLEIVAAEALWVRAPVYSGDLRRLVADADAGVASLGAGDNRIVVGRAVAGPPTSTPLDGTVDRYYALDAESSDFFPGERVMVSIPFGTEETLRSVPHSAVLHDPTGASWVYVCVGEQTYTRARIEVLRHEGDLAVFQNGPEVDACLAVVGAAELYGAEFEPGH